MGIQMGMMLEARKMTWTTLSFYRLMLIAQSRSRNDKLLIDVDSSNVRQGYPYTSSWLWYGVKHSDVFGVHSILRKEGFGCGASSSVALENMKKVVDDVTKENKELKTKCDESNGLLKKMTTQ